MPADTHSGGQPVQTRTPLLPQTLAGQRLPLRAAPPELGEHTDALLAELGYAPADIAALHQAGVIGAAAARPGAATEPANA